ncbi:unnamed protein product [Cylindrotheca closterium]|uniref:Reverse transcriptase Ty1/copia-type domain-containing protein n=1 Tax=Cylindrotheca closterium TaxID=2856 RepID=A0AAD2FGA7_9STRA|nr:unnamed protein product [Cylindrotheca closterium]
MFAHLPRGFYSNMRSITGERTVLHLKKSAYGTTIAPRLWYKHLMKAFHELGFESSSYDKCFLIRKDMMIVVYVDDCGISTDKPEKIDELVNQLKEKGFDLEIEGDFETFLGVKIRQMKDGRYHLLQEGLIKKVLEAAKMTDCSPNHVPAAPTPLGKDPNGEPWSQHPWRYSSIVGMLIYLCTNTRLHWVVQRKNHQRILYRQPKNQSSDIDDELPIVSNKFVLDVTVKRSSNALLD